MLVTMVGNRGGVVCSIFLPVYRHSYIIVETQRQSKNAPLSA